MPERSIEIAFKARLAQHLERIYGNSALLERLLQQVSRYRAQTTPDKHPHWDERDLILISYGDSILEDDVAPLESLARFLQVQLRDSISAVHLLPFYPYSSDDGFSVIDYRAVDPKLGDWQDIRHIGTSFELMADLVLNHASRQSLWFVDFINDTPPANGYFIEVDPDTDLRQVIRPRTTPLVVDVYTPSGIKHVWATFSEDQIDLNFANPDLLLEMIDILFAYIDAGARFVRLDAVAFLWKEIGTPCIHLPETHEVVKLLRTLVDELTPGVVLITETNVPHQENISYFGAGDEAQMVYQFALPPLVLHGLNRGNASYLTRWARSLPELPSGCTYLNFTASHDGVGVRAIEGLIPAHELNDLLDSVHQYGGFVSKRGSASGEELPYELNISLFDALCGTRTGKDIWQVERFLCSQTIMLALQGIPAVYIHSLTATPNDLDQVEATQRTRSINRHKWHKGQLELLLQDPSTPQARVFGALRRLMQIRRRQPVFHPDAGQEVLVLSDSLFALLRTSPCGGQSLLAIHNLSAHPQHTAPGNKLPDAFQHRAFDLISQKPFDVTEQEIQPYQCLWLVAQN